MQRGGDLLDEFVEFIGSEIADGPEIEALFGPMTDIVALNCLRHLAGVLGAQALRDKHHFRKHGPTAYYGQK